MFLPINTTGLNPTNNNPEDFLRAEYEYVTRLLINNEQLGERRIEFFVSLVTAVIGVSGLIGASDIMNFDIIGAENKTRMIAIIILISIGTIVPFGFITLERIIRRNLETDEYKAKLDKIRRYFIERDKSIADYVAFDPYIQYSRTKKWSELFSFGVGGFAETIRLINSIISGLFFGILVLAFKVSWEMAFYSLALSITIALVVWTLQFIYSNHRYSKFEKFKV